MTRPADSRPPIRAFPRLAAAALIAGAVAITSGCASSEPFPPSAAVQAVAETRAAAGLPPAQPVPEQPPPTEVEPSEGETPAASAEPAVGAGATADAQSAPAAPRPAEETPAEETPAERRRGTPKVVTIEPKGGIGAEPKTLAEAAAEARAERRSSPERASLVITNDNLAAFAAPGQVTVMTSEPAAGGETAGGAGADPAGASGAATASGGAAGSPAAARSADTASESDPPRGPEGASDEEYWRSRARDTRMRWAAASEEVERLEKEADELRWAFYAEDDGYYRDERIKPEWDRVLDDLRRARQDVRAYRRDVEELLEEGRRAGALPGWLREGIELEPEEPESREREPRTAEPVEPPVMGEGDRP